MEFETLTLTLCNEAPKRPLSKHTLMVFGRRIGVGALGAILLLGAYADFLHLSGNFNPVVPGQVYRSAQPTPSALRDYAARYKIRSIINLRGDNTGKTWYDDEVRTAGELGIKHIDFGISARKELDRNEVQQLIALMRDAPKPLLIHCNAGADRSGLASALYLADIAQQSEEVAEGQLSFYFGHISLPFIKEFAMDRTFEAMEPWLGMQRS